MNLEQWSRWAETAGLVVTIGDIGALPLNVPCQFFELEGSRFHSQMKADSGDNQHSTPTNPMDFFHTQYITRTHAPANEVVFVHGPGGTAVEKGVRAVRGRATLEDGTSYEARFCCTDTHFNAVSCGNGDGYTRFISPHALAARMEEGDVPLVYR